MGRLLGGLTNLTFTYHVVHKIQQPVDPAPASTKTLFIWCAVAWPQLICSFIAMFFGSNALESSASPDATALRTAQCLRGSDWYRPSTVSRKRIPPLAVFGLTTCVSREDHETDWVDPCPTRASPFSSKDAAFVTLNGTWVPNLPKCKQSRENPTAYPTTPTCPFTAGQETRHSTKRL